MSRADQKKLIAKYVQENYSTQTKVLFICLFIKSFKLTIKFLTDKHPPSLRLVPLFPDNCLD